MSVPSNQKTYSTDRQTSNQWRVIMIALFAGIAWLGLDNIRVIVGVVVMIAIIAAERIVVGRRSPPFARTAATAAMPVMLCFAAFAFLCERDIGYSFVTGGIVFVAFAVLLTRNGNHATAKPSLAIAAALAAIGAVELSLPPGTALLNPQARRLPKADPWVGPRPHVHDRRLGWIPVPEAKIKNTGVADWSARLDEKSRRIVPGQPARGPCILLSGGSFAFGAGINDDETIAARLQSRRQQNRVFNYAVNAYGTTQSLLRLKQAELREVSWVFYFFIENHFARNAGDVRWLRIFPGAPVMQIDERGKLVAIDDLRDRLRRATDRFMAHRSFFYERIVHLPPMSMTDDAKVRQTQGLIEAMARAAPRFVMVFVPMSGQTAMTAAQKILMERLTARGIDCLDLIAVATEHLESGRNQDQQALFTAGPFAHPTAYFADVIADSCAKLIDQAERGVD